MQLATASAGAFMKAATFKIKYTQSGIEKVGLSIQNMANDATSTTTFFRFDPFIFGLGTEIEFSGEFTLNNDEEYTFNATAIASSKLELTFNSCATLKDTSIVDDVNTNQVYGVTKLGIADFRRVEQEVCCYVAGEVSHIENILAREYKERETRSLTSVETTNERTTEREVENLTDTTTTERNEMQSEVAAVLNEDESKNYGASIGTNGGFGDHFNFNTNAYADFSSSSSTSDSNSQAQTYAQEVTERAMERIVQKVSSKRTTRILKEFEEKNTHGFDNTKGDQHVTGVYRWVDKIYKNSLINYGKRLMYEFAIPEPSKFFKEALKKQLEAQETTSNMIFPDAPDHPSVYNIDSASDLNGGNYQTIAAYYNAEVTPKPKDIIHINSSFEYAGYIKDEHETYSENKSLEIPAGYTAISTTVHASGMHDGDTRSGQGVSVTVGNQVFHNVNELYYNAVTLVPQVGTSFKPFTGELSLSFYSVNYVGVNAAIAVQCQLSAEAYEQWQNETYAVIMNAYEEKLRQYNEAALSDEVIPDYETETIRFNPLYNRSLEKREIKRIALELLTEQKGHDISKENYGLMNTTTSIAKVTKNAGLQTHAATVKFFEQAFDWEIMAYIFYPYFYADERNWVDLFQSTDAADPLFQAFLQSGMARAVVPVRTGFEDAVNWYMETGEIWNGQGLVIDQDDDLYVSVADEMQTIEGTVEGTWETRLPTSLTIVQAESAALTEGGLPCFCEENEVDNPIDSSTELIGGTAGVTIGGIGKFVVSS